MPIFKSKLSIAEQLVKIRSKEKENLAKSRTKDDKEIAKLDTESERMNSDNSYKGQLKDTMISLLPMDQIVAIRAQTDLDITQFKAETDAKLAAIQAKRSELQTKSNVQEQNLKEKELANEEKKILEVENARLGSVRLGESITIGKIQLSIRDQRIAKIDSHNSQVWQNFVESANEIKDDFVAENRRIAEHNHQRAQSRNFQTEFSEEFDSD